MFGQITRKREKQSTVDLNRVVTPMLDMTFQVLFFLIMNFRLASAEGQVNLVVSDPADNSEGQGVVLDEKDEYRVRLIASTEPGKKGLLGKMTWKPKHFNEEEITLTDIPPSEHDPYARELDRMFYGLYLKLKEVQPRQGSVEPQIKIEAEGGLRYSELLRVMDVARKLGFKNVAVSTNRN